MAPRASASPPASEKPTFKNAREAIEKSDEVFKAGRAQEALQGFLVRANAVPPSRFPSPSARKVERESVCVCVRERERERESARGGTHQRSQCCIISH